MSERPDGCTGPENGPCDPTEPKVIHENPERTPPGDYPRADHDRHKEAAMKTKPDCGPEVAKATRMSTAMAEIVDGTAKLVAAGVSPDAALNATKEVWDKVTNHDILAVGMASFEGQGGIPTLGYQLGGRQSGKTANKTKNDVRGFTRTESHPGLAEKLGLQQLDGLAKYMKADPLGGMQAGSGIGKMPTPKAMAIETIKMCGLTADEVDGLAQDMRQKDHYRKITIDDFFNRAYRIERNVHPVSELPKLLAEGWEIDPEWNLGEGGCGGSPYGWSFSFSTSPLRRLRRTTPVTDEKSAEEYKFVESNMHALVTFRGDTFVSQDVTECRTYKKKGQQEFEKAVFRGIKAYADDHNFFYDEVRDNGLSRHRMYEAKYEFARIIVELRLMSQVNREQYMSDELSKALEADEFGQVIKEVFQGPMSSG